VTRRERDLDHARRSGLTDAARDAFLERCAAFDRNTPGFIAREGGDWWDTHAGMLVRIERVVCDLIDQLADEARPWPG